MVSDCLFCRVVAGEIPADVIHETPDILAFRDIAPKAPVHVLVITKAHHADLAALAAADPAMAGTVLAAAALVVRSRAAGLLALDAPVGGHLGMPAHGALTARGLLSHTAGLRREPFGDVWDSLDAPDLARLLADLTRVERVLPPGRRYHYS